MSKPRENSGRIDYNFKSSKGAIKNKTRLEWGKKWAGSLMKWLPI